MTAKILPFPQPKRPKCWGCYLKVPAYDGVHQEDTGIPGFTYCYPCANDKTPAPVVRLPPRGQR